MYFILDFHYKSADYFHLENKGYRYFPKRIDMSVLKIIAIEFSQSDILEHLKI